MEKKKNKNSGSLEYDLRDVNAGGKLTMILPANGDNPILLKGHDISPETSLIFEDSVVLLLNIEKVMTVKTTYQLVEKKNESIDPR
jgi:hypothetical protein